MLTGVDGPYLTRRELAEHLNVSQATVQRWQNAGMPVERWGRRLVRYRLDRVTRWLDRRKTTALSERETTWRS